MSLFDKLKSEAAGAARHANSGIAGLAANDVSGAITNASNKSWRVTFQDIPTTLDKLRALPEAALKEPHHAAALLVPVLCL